ncbi:MAG: hypothetical protein SangKO_014870 [Sandaracinaceae bacterium]
MKNRIHSLILVPTVALAALVTGCSLGGPGPLAVDAANRTSLIEVTPGTIALDQVDSTAWMAAPAGCEDRLDGATDYALAGADSGLVAAVDESGSIVCVDTVESVQEELEKEGLDDEADELGERYLLALDLAALPSAEDIASGDPSPQPSMSGSGGNRAGDPSPQPSTNPHADDPSPQPSSNPRG